MPVGSSTVKGKKVLYAKLLAQRAEQASVRVCSYCRGVGQCRVFPGSLRRGTAHSRHLVVRVLDREDSLSSHAYLSYGLVMDGQPEAGNSRPAIFNLGMADPKGRVPRGFA